MHLFDHYFGNFLRHTHNTLLYDRYFYLAIYNFLNLYNFFHNHMNYFLYFLNLHNWHQLLSNHLHFVNDGLDWSNRDWFFNDFNNLHHFFNNYLHSYYLFPDNWNFFNDFFNSNLITFYNLILYFLDDNISEDLNFYNFDNFLINNDRLLDINRYFHYLLNNSLHRHYFFNHSFHLSVLWYNMMNRNLNLLHLSINHNTVDYLLHLYNLWYFYTSLNNLLANSGHLYYLFFDCGDLYKLFNNIIYHFNHLNWHMNDFFNFYDLGHFNYFFDVALNRNNLRYLDDFLNNLFNDLFNLNDLGDNSEHFKNVINVDYSHNLLIYHADNSLI